MMDKSIVTTLTKISFWIYLIIFAGAGFFGMVAAPLELQNLVGLKPSSIEPQVYASLTHELRFLRAAELGFAILCMYLSGMIFSSRKLSLLFALTAGLVTAARIISFLVDGQPNSFFILFAAGEGITALLMYFYSRRLP